MGYIIFALILGIIAALGFIVSRKSPNRDERRGGIAVGCAASAAAVILILIGSITTISANTVGVVTAYGKYKGIEPSGLHWLAPWDDVEEFGTRIQPLEMDGVGIRFEGNSGGTANLLVEWRIQSDSEPSIRQLWSDYRTFDAIQNRVVQSRARNALNVTLAGYSPNDGVSGASIVAIQNKTREIMQQDLRGTGVIVERVTVRQIDPDAGSQDRINKQVQANADLARLPVNQEIADREAIIARTRASTQTPGTLQQNCLDIVDGWDVSKRGPLPATFNCAFAAPQSPVVVGGR